MLRPGAWASEVVEDARSSKALTPCEGTTGSAAPRRLAVFQRCDCKGDSLNCNLGNSGGPGGSRRRGSGMEEERGRLRARITASAKCPGMAIASNTVLAGTALFAQTQRATAAGVKGVTPCRRRRVHEEPWQTTDVPLVEPGLEDSPPRDACFSIPAGW